MLRITGLMAEVSREANATGALAGQLRGNSGAVADDVVSLRTALIHTVRTATVEADRRLQPRVTVDVACSVSFDGGGAPVSGRLRDVSSNGATIEITITANIAAGQTGRLILNHAAGAGAQFEVRSTSSTATSPGRLHVQFLMGKSDLAFTEAIKRLMQTGGPAARAA